MKLTKNLFVVLIAVVAVVSCSKSNDGFSVPGKWEGSLTDGDNGSYAFYGIQFNADGSLSRYKSDGEVLATGSYEIIGDSIKASYQFPSGSKYSIVGFIDKGLKKMKGTWGSGTKTKGLGYWNAVKK